MAKEIDAVTIPELLEAPITATDYIPFSSSDGTMKRATAGNVAVVLTEPIKPVFSNNLTDTTSGRKVIVSTGTDNKDRLSNILSVDDGSMVEFTEVSSYVDGTPMTDAKVSSSGGMYVKYSNKYFLKSVDLSTTKNLIVNSVDSLRNISTKTSILIRLGYYSIAETKGYYTENDGGSARYVIQINPSGSDDGFLTIKPLNDAGLQFKLELTDYLNVRVAGAKGDGTFNDTAYIQKAIDFCPIGLDIFIPGVHLVTKLQFGKNNICFFGDESSEIMTNTTSEMFELLDCENVTFKSVKFSSYFNNPDLSYSTWGVFYSVNKILKNINIIDCKFTNPNTYTNAVKLVFETASSYIDGLTIDRCGFTAVGRMAIELQNHSALTDEKFLNINISQNNIYNLGTVKGLDGWYGMGISVSGLGRNVATNNNYIDKFVGIGIEIVGGSTAVEVIGNKFKNAYDTDRGNGVKTTNRLLSVDGKVRDITAVIEDNKTLDTDASGSIYFRRIINSPIAKNSFYLSGEFYLRDLQKVYFDTNNIKTSFNRLIYMETSTGGGTFKDVTFVDNELEVINAANTGVIVSGPNVGRTRFIGGRIKRSTGKYLSNTNNYPITFESVIIDDGTYQLPFQVNLPDSDFVLEENAAQMPVIQFGGTLTATRSIILPVSQDRITKVFNNTTSPLLFKVVGGTIGVIVQAGFSDDIIVRYNSIDVVSNEERAKRFSGSGSPDGVVGSVSGGIYRRKDVGELYIKGTNSGNTGWEKVMTNVNDKASTFTIAASSQTNITIPHGFGVTPSFTNVTAKSSTARAAGITSWTEDATNITITLTTPQASGSMVYSWEARV